MEKNWWLKLFLVVSAMILGAWIPLRLIYFGPRMPFDIAVDLLTLTFISLHHLYLFRKNKAHLKDEAQLSKSIFNKSIFLDLMIAIPFDVIFEPWLGESSRYFLLTKMLILNRLFYISQLLDAFASLHPIVYRLVPVVVFMPMLVHLVACAWIVLGSGTIGPDPDHILEYVRAVYWSFTTLTTVGYGDISAKTIPQMLFTCMTQVIGVGVFGFILSNVASVLARLDSARDHHLGSLDRVETFMNYNHLTPPLKSKIRSYYHYIWETHRGYDDNDVLNTLPGQLRAEIALELNRSIIHKVPLLAEVSGDVLQDVVMSLKPHVYVPNERIFLIDEPGDAMYFIHSGAIDIIGRDGHLLVTLQTGQFFGEMALVNNMPRNATARARSYCDLYVLSREDFEKVTLRHPNFAAHIQKIAQERMAPKAS